MSQLLSQVPAPVHPPAPPPAHPPAPPPAPVIGLFYANHGLVVQLGYTQYLGASGALVFTVLVMVFMIGCSCGAIISTPPSSSLCLLLGALAWFCADPSPTADSTPTVAGCVATIVFTLVPTAASLMATVFTPTSLWWLPCLGSCPCEGESSHSYSRCCGGRC